MKRLREALIKAYDAGYKHGKPKRGITGHVLAGALIGEGYRLGDCDFLRKAYSAGIWDRVIDDKEDNKAAGRG